MLKCKLEDFKSIDQDYQGQKFYHEGEKVKIVNPDSKYYNKTGIYRGYRRTNNINDIYLIELDG